MILFVTGFLIACVSVIYRSRMDNQLSQKISNVIVLLGAAIALFVSEFVSINRYPLSFERVGALIMLSGFLFLIFWESKNRTNDLD